MLAAEVWRNTPTLKNTTTFPRAAGGEMLEDRRVRPSDDLLLAVFVALAVVVPFLIGYRGEAIAEAISRFLSPIGLLLLPIGLLLMIQFLSSEQATFFSNAFSTGGPDSIHRASGSPVGVALFLVLVLFLLCNRISIFGGVDGSHE